MLNTDIKDLTSHERRVLQDAFHEGTSPRRTRGVILSALVVVTGVVLFTAFGASIIFLAGLTVATLVVSTTEKLVYQRNMESYESLIRKLANRLESLEGVPQTESVPASSMPGVNVSGGFQERKAQRVQLTEAGVLLLARARGILSSADEAQRELAELSTGAIGRLRVGAGPTMAEYLLPQVVGGLLSRFPRIELRVMSALNVRSPLRDIASGVQVVEAIGPW